MDSTVISIIVGMAGVIAGIIAGKFIFAKDTKKQIEDAEQQAQRILTDAQLQAETLKKEKILEAKEKFVQLKSDHDKEVFDRNRKISDLENRAKQNELSLNQKEVNLDKQLKDNEAIKENLNRQLEVVSQKRTELEKHQEEHIRRLEKIAALTAEEARNQSIDSLKQEAQSRALSIQQDIIDDAKQKANKEARKIIIQTIQRTAAEQAIDR